MKLENITSTITIAWILNILSSIVYKLLFTEDIDGSKRYESNKVPFEVILD